MRRKHDEIRKAFREVHDDPTPRAIFRNEGSFLDYVEYCHEIFRNCHGFQERILDVGAGFGLMTLLFEIFGATEVVGLELEDRKIEIFENLCDILGSRNTSIEQASAVALPHSARSFGVVSAIELISHVGDLNAFLVEASRVLEDNGRLYVSDTNNALSLPLRRSRSKIWQRAEEGPPDRVYPIPFRELRSKIIQTRFPSLDEGTLFRLSRETKGMWRKEIIDGVNEYLMTGGIAKKPTFLYRDPLSGVFPEFPFNPYELSTFVEKHGFHVHVQPLPPYSVEHPLLHKLGAAILLNIPHQIVPLFYYAFPKFEILAQKTIADKQSVMD